MTPRILWMSLACLLVALPVRADDELDGLEAGVYARIDTTLGAMTFVLHAKQAPRTVGNFVDLAEGAKPEGAKAPFYNGLTFHRVIKGFMIQGGCPKGDGTGSPGYRFKDEVNKSLRHTDPGVLSMANSDPPSKAPWSNAGKTNGSQFFVTLRATPHLDGKHTVFGKLVKGLGEEALLKIGAVKTGKNDRPVEAVRIKSVKIVRKRAALPKAKAVDEARVPKPDQPSAPHATVDLICIQYAGCSRAGVMAKATTKTQALAIGQAISAAARAKGANFARLAQAHSDLARVEFRLVQAKNHPTLAPAYALKPGQVSDPVQTPYGVMVFRGK